MKKRTKRRPKSLPTLTNYSALFWRVCAYTLQPGGLATREAEITLANGQIVPEGDKVVIDLQTANRDTTVLAKTRQISTTAQHRGQSQPGRHVVWWRHARLSGDESGGGHHAPEGEAPNPDNHQFGTITLIIKELIERGMRPNPDSPPTKIEASERDVWATYPVLF